MNDKEAFEDIIADKFNEAEFPFDEMNWDGAEEMIASHRKKEKRRRSGLIFFSGIAIGILIMLPFVMKINDSQNKLIAEAAQIKNDNSNSSIVNAPITAEGAKSGTNSIESEIASDRNIETIADQKNAAEVSQKHDLININNNISTSKPGKSKAHGHPAFISHFGNTKQPDNLVQKPIDSILFPENFVKLATIPVALDSIGLLKPDSATMVTWVDVPNNKTSLKLPWNVSVGMGGNYVKNFSFNPIQGIEITKSISLALT